MKPNSLCDHIKAKASLRGVAALLNIDLPTDGRKFRSPFRPDKSPSCSVKEDVLTDWTTGERFDQIDFFAAARNIPQGEAIRGLAQIYQIVGDLPFKPMASPASTDHRDRKALARENWPHFEKPSAAEIRQIADLRGVSTEGVQLAVDRGILYTVTDRNARAWAVTDSVKRNARIRRMDGNLWYGESKSMPPTGGGQDSAWPVGILGAQEYSAIAIVEGEGEILAGYHLAWCYGIESSLAVVGMLGASNQISQDALPHFLGRRVRIFEDNDPAGETAAARWAQQLWAAGATVDLYSFRGLIKADGSAVKDMTDFSHLHPDQWESERARIESAFSFSTQHSASKC